MDINTFRMPIKDLSIPTFEERSAIIKLIDETIDKINRFMCIVGEE